LIFSIIKQIRTSRMEHFVNIKMNFFVICFFGFI
jgi:hypothetical protein